MAFSPPHRPDAASARWGAELFPANRLCQNGRAAAGAGPRALVGASRPGNPPAAVGAGSHPVAAPVSCPQGLGVPVMVHRHQLQRGECQLGRTHRVPVLGRVPGCSCGAPRCPVTHRGWCRTPGAGRGFGDAAGGPAARTGAEGSRSPCRLPAGGEMPWEGAGPARLGVGSCGASEPKAEAAPARPAWPGWQLPATGALPVPGAVPGLLPLQIFKAPAPRRRLPRPLPRCPPACPRAPGASCLRRHRYHGEEPVTLCRGWWLSPGMLAGVRLGSARSCGIPGGSGGASARLRGCHRLGDAGADAVGRGRQRWWGDSGGRCVTEHGSGGSTPLPCPEKCWLCRGVPEPLVPPASRPALTGSLRRSGLAALPPCGARAAGVVLEGATVGAVPAAVTALRVHRCSRESSWLCCPDPSGASTSMARLWRRRRSGSASSV